ncbi:MAG: aminotransferase class V-fold PLP-dependent enzyme [Bacteroidetes bacterium]|nr:aminotransferase class V-fold PLP-dependent enzyme [Bacteroidota bacterium]
MSLIYFTPGPSELYPSYRKHLLMAMDLQLGSINHRSDSFRKIYKYTDEQLRLLMNIPDTHQIYFAASATEIWEKLISNCVELESFHLTNGSFSNKFFDFAKLLKKSPKQYQVAEGEGFDVHSIEIPESSELICTTLNETSTGVRMLENDLKFLKQKYPQKLLCSDLVSIAPYANIDFSVVDSVFFSVQKAFGMPPGLGVWIANKACLDKSSQLHAKNIHIGAHHTLQSFYTNYLKFETPSTPNVMAIYILGKIAADMNQYGIQQIRDDIHKKSDLIYSFAEGHPDFHPFVRLTEHRSHTVAVLNTIHPAKQTIEKLQEKGFMIGSGYGVNKHNQIRIANFPSTSFVDLQKMLHGL